jgi:hypothetical protein
LLGKRAPKTKDARVVDSKKAAVQGLLVTAAATADALPDLVAREMVHTADTAVERHKKLKSSSVKAFVGFDGVVGLDVVVADAVTVASLTLAVAPDFNCRTAVTAKAVVNRVQKKPPTITAPILATSTVDPTLSAKGKAMSDGTKKTGNHLAKSVAPGASLDTAACAVLVGNVKSVTNSKLHAPKLLGKAMERLRKRRRKAMSIATNAAAEIMA